MFGLVVKSHTTGPWFKSQLCLLTLTSHRPLEVAMMVLEVGSLPPVGETCTVLLTPVSIWGVNPQTGGCFLSASQRSTHKGHKQKYVLSPDEHTEDDAAHEPDTTGHPRGQS